MLRMNRIEGLLDGVDYHQFYFQADDPTVFLPAYPPGGPANRLLAATETGHAVCVSTGIAMGVVHLAIELLDSPPSGVDDSHDWEAIADVSMIAAVPTATIVLLMQRTKPPFDGFELPSGASTYRIRGHATGRSLDFDVVVDGIEQLPREHHLLQLWPVDRLEPPTVRRADDPWARQWPPYKTPIKPRATRNRQSRSSSSASTSNDAWVLPGQERTAQAGLQLPRDHRRGGPLEDLIPQMLDSS